MDTYIGPTRQIKALVLHIEIDIPEIFVVLPNLLNLLCWFVR